MRKTWLISWKLLVVDVCNCDDKFRFIFVYNTLLWSVEVISSNEEANSR